MKESACINESDRSSRKAPIVVEATLKKGTYIKLSLLQAFHVWSFYFCLSALIMATVLFHVLDAPDVLFLFIWGLFGFYAATVIINALYMAFSSKNFSFFLPTAYTFDDEIISAKTELAQGTIKWNAVVGLKVVADHYVLSFSVIGFIAVPKSKIPPESVSRFEKVLHDNIQKR